MRILFENFDKEAIYFQILCTNLIYTQGQPKT
jgi:hypothetical protein